jgi:excisionase family DNA binding protein
MGRADSDVSWLSLGPASRRLGVASDTLRRWSDEGLIRSFATPGGHRRFDVAEIERIVASRAGATATGRSLAGLGATPDRLARAYRRSYGTTAERSVRDAVPTADHAAYRTDGRSLVASLVAFLDAADPADRAAAEDAAAALTDDLAVRLARAGFSLTESVGLFVAARRPFLTELGVIVRRRALDPSRISALFEAASAILDRLLLRLITTHQATTEQASDDPRQSEA